MGVAGVPTADPQAWGCSARSGSPLALAGLDSAQDPRLRSEVDSLNHSLIDDEVEYDFRFAAVNPGGSRPIRNIDGERGLGCAIEELRYLFCPLDAFRCSQDDRRVIAFYYDVGGEELQQSGEVTAAGCGQKRVHHLPVSLPFRGRRLRRRRRHFASRPRGQLAGGRRRLPQDFRNRGKFEPEAVVQHKRNPLGRGQPIEQDMKCDTDRFGESNLLRRVGRGFNNLCSRFGHRDAGSQPVQTQSGRHCRQLGRKVVDVAVCSIHPQPRILDDILGFM